MSGIRITGTPAEVANATKTLAIAFKGATLEEVLVEIRKQRLTAIVKEQLSEIFRED